MRTLRLARRALFFALSLFVLIYAVRLVQRTDFELDPSGRQISTLSTETIDFLHAFEGRLDVTYFASERHTMPSHLKHVEQSVSGLLESMRSEAPDRLDVRVIDPVVSGPVGAAYAARKRASGVSVRRVLRDEHDQQQVWSSLVLAQEGFEEVLIQDIQADDLPHLQALIVETLAGNSHPRPPRFGVAAPLGFELLGQLLSRYGSVERVDLDAGNALPSEVDLLFWIQPSRVSRNQLRQLQRFLEQGRTVVLAGSAYSVGYELTEDAVRYRARLLPDGWPRLLSSLGVKPVPDLLMDTNAGPVILPTEQGQTRQVEAPFQLRCLPAFYNMKGFLGPARGGLSFLAASSLEVDPRRLAAVGLKAEIVGTTTERAWIQPLPTRPFLDGDLAPALTVGKQSLMLLLKSQDSSKGQALILASASPFQDGIINQPGYGHRIYLQTLVRTFSETQRLARIRIFEDEVEAVADLTDVGRVWWRVFVVFLVPGMLAAVGAWLYLRSGRTLPRWSGGRLPVLELAVVAAVLVASLWAGKSAFATLAADLTQGATHTISPFLRNQLDRHKELQIDLVTSSRANLPAALKNVETRVVTLLEQGGIEPRRLRADYLNARDKQLLRKAGMTPFETSKIVRDTVISQPVWSGLRLRLGERSTVIPRLDTHTVDHLGFLIGAALRRLESDGAPHLAVVSDLPRLSPAEALEDYQKKGLLAPGGADVYSRVKSLLKDYGYEVTHIDQREPRLPADADLLIWLQPRRDSRPVIEKVADHLSRGGKALVALQHFNIQQRQYRGSGFETVYWPQPQFQDFDQYLRLFGVEQVREVLMDRTRSHLDLETQVNRTAFREYDAQQVALPFLIRSVAANYSDSSVVTRRLGDLLFVWGNRFRIDTERLRQAGLDHRTLVATSSRSWSFPWKGGWLPAEIFNPTGYLPGFQPLVLMLEGRFQPVEFVANAEGRQTLRLRSGALDQPGKLLLIGSSEMFKDPHLHNPNFHHDQLMLNAVADLTYGGELASLQTQRRVFRGFAPPDSSSKTGWRLFVLLGGPALILCLGSWRYGRLQFGKAAR